MFDGVLKRLLMYFNRVDFFNRVTKAEQKQSVNPKLTLATSVLYHVIQYSSSVINITFTRLN